MIELKKYIDKYKDQYETKPKSGLLSTGSLTIMDSFSYSKKIVIMILIKFNDKV